MNAYTLIIVLQLHIRHFVNPPNTILFKKNLTTLRHNQSSHNQGATLENSGAIYLKINIYLTVLVFSFGVKNRFLSSNTYRKKSKLYILNPNHFDPPMHWPAHVSMFKAGFALICEKVSAYRVKLSRFYEVYCKCNWQCSLHQSYQTIFIWSRSKVNLLLQQAMQKCKLSKV